MSPPLNVADNRLPAAVDVNVFDRNFLSALAPMPAQCFQQSGVRSIQYVGLPQIFLAAFKCLLRHHRPPIALHRRIVRGEKLDRQHTLEFVIWRNPGRQAMPCDLPVVNARRLWM